MHGNPTKFRWGGLGKAEEPVDGSFLNYCERGITTGMGWEASGPLSEG